jgi:hypothetical protein
LIKNHISWFWGAWACRKAAFAVYWFPNLYPMKIRNSLSVCVFLLAGLASQAQPDTATISRNALTFADSLIKTDAYGNFSSYAGLTPASVLKYYGGADGYIQHVNQLRTRTTSQQEEMYPVLNVETLRPMDDQWQCVIRVSRYFHKDNVQYHYVTYFVGQSKDEGANWRLFDVSYNPVGNMIYIFPEVITDLPIKQPVILSQDQEEKLAQQQTAAATQGAKKSKK